jgi:hypothetical protein
MTRTRPSPQLTKKQRRRLSDFDTAEAEQQRVKRAASGQAAMIRQIRRDVRTWPEAWLARLNSEGIPPDGAPHATRPTWRLVVDALRDLARAARVTRGYELERQKDFGVKERVTRHHELELLSSYLKNFRDWARTLGEPHAAVCRTGAAWLKAFVDLPRVPLPRLRECGFCPRWYWDMSPARRQRYCSDRCKKNASEARLARKNSPRP